MAPAPLSTLARLSAIALLLTVAVACAPKGGTAPPPPRPVEMPTYDELARQYNANLDGLERVWSRANVRAFFRDDKGRFRTETGEDSFFMAQPPYRVALSLGKLGKTGLWVGCNEQMYWLFDVHESQTVWYGRHENLGRPSTQPLPMPVHPLRLLQLMGLTPLPLTGSAEDEAVPVEWVDHAFLIEPPGTGTRMLLDPRTLRPKRIDLIDPRGVSVIMAYLSGTLLVERGGIARDHWPAIADRIDVRIAGEDGYLLVRLHDATDGRGNARIDRALTNAFDFATLIQSLNPQQAIDLDTAP